MLCKKIFFLFLINKREQIKANAGKNIGKTIRLLIVGKISDVKLDLQSVLSNKLVCPHFINSKVEVS
tara:strand:+ start:836 stop:1036 length:201 start_codon:yes stop_codon:yes gene_type:complete